MSRRQNEPSWLDTYYAGLEFIYWEPQHLGRVKNPTAALKSITDVRTRLRRMEVTLNHNLDQFLRLAPSGLRRRLFEKAFGRSFPDEFHMHGREVDTEFALANAMQPDFVFEAAADIVSIEMKVGARSSVEQVLKCALLGVAIESRRQSQFSHNLLMLSQGTFANLWKERFASPTEVLAALAAYDLSTFLSKRHGLFRNLNGPFARVVGGLQIAWLSYTDLSAFLRAHVPGPEDTTEGAQVYRHLITGMLAELSSRGLVSDSRHLLTQEGGVPCR